MPGFRSLRQRFVAIGAAAGIALTASVPLLSASAAAAAGSAAVTPTTTTLLKDGATGQQWGGDETTGATAFDTATVWQTDGPVATGTVTYTFFADGSCQGTGAPESVTLVDGVPPDATATGPLAAGAYSYDAVYNGDGNYNPSPVSACEPFTVGTAPTNVVNVVFSEQTGLAWSGTETAGGKADDRASLVGVVPGFVPTGTATYSYFANGTCGGTSVWTDTVSLNSAGAIPNSNATDPLGAGTYSFEVIYNGDSNYAASAASACQAFVVTPITDLGPILNPSGTAPGTDGAGGTAGAVGTPAPTPTTGTEPAPVVAAPSSYPTTPPVATLTADTPAVPATQPALAWTGADVGETAAIAFGLLALGSLLTVLGRRRRGEAG